MALGHLSFYRFPTEKKQLRHQQKKPEYLQVYTNTYKYTQDIQDIYKIPGGGQAAATRPGPSCIHCLCLYIFGCN